jgi:hypothetical protein
MEVKRELGNDKEEASSLTTLEGATRIGEIAGCKVGTRAQWNSRGWRDWPEMTQLENAMSKMQINMQMIKNGHESVYDGDLL